MVPMTQQPQRFSPVIALLAVSAAWEGQLSAILKDLGITPDKEVITHCQTHHRSGFTYLVAKSLGYPRVKGYAGSWGEWGNHPDTPVELPVKN